MDEYDGYSDASSPQTDTRVSQRMPGTLDANPHVNRALTNRLCTHRRGALACGRLTDAMISELECC